MTVDASVLPAGTQGITELADDVSKTGQENVVPNRH